LKKDNTAIYLTRGERKGEFVANEHIQEQALMLKELNKLGYLARFGIGYDKTIELINWYLNEHSTELSNTELF